MTIARYYTKPKPAPSSSLTAAIRPVISAGFSTEPQWEARTGSDRNYPPRSKVAREITAQLTPEEKAAIFAAALANAESTAGLSVALIPVSSDVRFSMSEATPVIEQLVNDGSADACTGCRAAQLMTTALQLITGAMRLIEAVESERRRRLTSRPTRSPCSINCWTLGASGTCGLSARVFAIRDRCLHRPVM